MDNFKEREVLEALGIHRWTKVFVLQQSRYRICYNCKIIQFHDTELWNSSELNNSETRHRFAEVWSRFKKKAQSLGIEYD